MRVLPVNLNIIVARNSSSMELHCDEQRTVIYLFTYLFLFMRQHRVRDAVFSLLAAQLDEDVFSISSFCSMTGAKTSTYQF